MSNTYDFLAQTFGPMLQVMFTLFLLLLYAWCVCAAAYWLEQRLIRAGDPILWAAPLPALATGMLYGGLRFSGILLYDTDGWSSWGRWNYTNQNQGAFIIFLCGCLLLGAVLARYKENHTSSTI